MDSGRPSNSGSPSVSPLAGIGGRAATAALRPDPDRGAGQRSCSGREDERQIGIVTRAVSWLLDAALINLVALGVGLGADLILSIFPLSPDLSSVLKPIAAVAYAVWAAAYFIGFWSTTGQTPGARLMQIRLVTAKGEKLKPRRALLRWIGMNLAMVPLFAGYLPIPFGRRGFPDWLAHTLVLDAPQLSVAQMRREAKRAARGDGRAPSTGEPGPSSSVSEVTRIARATDTVSLAITSAETNRSSSSAQSDTERSLNNGRDPRATADVEHEPNRSP